ncbi:RNA polymerase factor sigma-54 [Paenibacillus cremeus]|nr:RNA polymerase factor sigma-54 [Paenibacillus cremeus]
MSPGYGMYQQQSAKLQMTPQLRQAIKILQLSTPELLDWVQQELQDNPVLELDGASAGGWEQGVGRRGAGLELLQHAADHQPSLEGHLREQLSFIQPMSRTLRRIVLYMIGNLDTNGYLEPTLDEIALTLHVQADQVEQALAILQSMEPAGVGARGLRECLLLQVRALPDSSPLVPLLIKHHLEAVAGYHVHKLAVQLKASTQEIKLAMNVIKSLNPRPGAAFHAGDVKYMIPDVMIDKVGEQFVVRMNEMAAPRLSLNGQYERMVQEGGGNQEVRQFLRERLNAAAFFVRCIEQRRWTVYRVTQAIAEEQIEFLQKGAAHLRPMNLRQIADKVHLHESTVSRATAGKYAQTPWGVFELSFFFPSGVSRELGEAASSESVKTRLRAWIEQEDRSKPHSDQKLADLLTEEGIQISRRTVAKYREELGLASSVRRKRL